MWFMLQSDIAEAKELPAPPDPEVTRMEFDMKDHMIRNTIIPKDINPIIFFSFISFLFLNKSHILKIAH